MPVRIGLSDIKEGDRKIFSTEGFNRFVLVVGIAGMLLILLSQLLSSPAKKQVSKTETAEMTMEQYEQEIERRLTELVTSIQGVGRAKVMVTLESGIEYIYATQERKRSENTQDFSEDKLERSHSSSDEELDYIIFEGADGKQALVRTRLEPGIKGVVVICDGADNKSVENSVVNVVTTALGILSTRVFVAKIA